MSAKQSHVQRGWAGDSVGEHAPTPTTNLYVSLLVVFIMTQFWGDKAPRTPVVLIIAMSPVIRAAYIFVCMHLCVLIMRQSNNHFSVTQRCCRHAVFVFGHLQLESLSLIALDTLPYCLICLTHCGQSGALFPYFARRYP